MSLTKVSFSMINGALVNALDYGADPTGVADSTSNIQAAIDAGGMIYLPPGTYKISTLNFTGKDTAGLVSNGKATLTSTLTTGGIISVDNSAGGSSAYRIGIDGVNITCASFQQNVSAIKLVGNNSGGAGTGAAPYSFFKNALISNVGIALDLNRNWIIDCERLNIFYCSTALKITNAMNGFSAKSCVFGGLSEALINAGATRGNLVDLQYARAVHISGGSIEGICDRAISIYRTDGVNITANFIEVTPNRSTKIEESGAINITENFYRLGDTGAIQVADAALVPVIYVLIATPASAGVYAASQTIGVVSNNQFQIDKKPTSGIVTLFDSNDPAFDYPGLIRVQGNLITMSGLQPTGINSPVLFTDYLPDSGMAIGEFKTMITRETIALQASHNFKNTTAPAITAMGLVAGRTYPNNLRVRTAVYFRQVSGGAAPTGTYTLNRWRDGTTTTMASVSGTLTDNGALQFIGSSLSSLEVLIGDRVFVSGPGGGAVDSFWEAEILLVEYDPQVTS